MEKQERLKLELKSRLIPLRFRGLQQDIQKGAQVVERDLMKNEANAFGPQLILRRGLRKPLKVVSVK